MRPKPLDQRGVLLSSLNGFTMKGYKDISEEKITKLFVAPT
jgi:hypothetical protein